MILGNKSNNNVVYRGKYHCVWYPKYRRKVLEGKIAKRCEQVIRKTATKYRAEIIALEIMLDHLHLLVEIDPQFGIHPANQEHQRRVFARFEKRVCIASNSNAYFVSTVGGAPIAVIKQYVENQKDV